MKLIFVTSNPLKFKACKQVLGDIVDLEQKSLELTEIQGTPLEVAIEKAHQAFEILKTPLIINDSALVIKALNGFPGAYAKYVEDTLGEKILKLMESEKERSAYYLDYLVYIDKYGYQVFTSKTKGKILESPIIADRPYDKIFAKENDSKSAYQNSTYDDFLTFLKKRRVARGITFFGSKVLLLKRSRLDENKRLNYYAIPGGGLETLETPEDALIRELKEETSINVKPLKYLGMDTYEKGVTYYFLTKYLDGKVQLGGEEKENNNPDNYYEIALIDISELANLKIYGIGKEMIEKAYEMLK